MHSLNEDELNPFANDTSMLFKSFNNIISLGKVYEDTTSSIHGKAAEERVQLKEKTKLAKALLSSSMRILNSSR